MDRKKSRWRYLLGLRPAHALTRGILQSPLAVCAALGSSSLNLLKNICSSTLTGGKLCAVVALTGLLGSGTIWAHIPQTFEIIYASGPLTVNGKTVEEGFIGEATSSVVQTGAATFATIELEDGSVHQLAPGSTVRLGNALHHYQRTQFETNFELDIGEITSKLPRNDGVKRDTRMQTPSVAIGVRGTTFRVTDQNNTSRLMVYEGKVTAKGAVGDEVEVPADFGTVVEAGSPVRPPSELPSPPTLILGDSTEDEQLLRFRWQPNASAQRWSLEIAHDHAFVRTVYAELFNQTEAQVTGLKPRRRYYWRVSSVDDLNLHGPASEPAMVENKYYRQAQAAERQAQQARAEINIQTDKATSNRTFETWLSRANSSLRDGNLLTARRVYDVLIQSRPDSIDLLLNRGETSYLLLNYLDARTDYESVLQLDPDNARARLGLAKADVREGNFRRAEATLAELVDTVPLMHELLETAAMAALGLGDRDRSSALLLQALTIDPTNTKARTLLSSIQAGTKVMEELR